MNLEQQQGHKKSRKDNKVNEKENAALISFRPDDLAVAYVYRV